jgi:enoyl-CoA hydratase
MDESVLNYEVKDNVAIVTLNRPKAMNAVSPELACRLADAWNAARDDDNVRVIIVTGTGKAFCAGVDLGKLAPLITGAKKPETEWDHRVVSHENTVNRGLLRDMDCEKPVIAAVNGLAIGGGCEIVQGSDIRVASTEAKFGLGEVRWGVMPSGGSTARLPAQMPFARAMEILLTGAFISAEEAKEIGFVNHVVPPDQLMAKALEIAGLIKANGPFSVKSIRASVRACIGVPEHLALKIEQQFVNQVAKSEDAQEGPKAFIEKRKPVFKGR